ncbi:hypothetical protein D3C72_1678980 [compost metagenome]
MQAHQRVRVAMLRHLPGNAVGNGDTQLLLQLPAQGLLHRLTLFQLAAGKLPPARTRLARRAAGDQQCVVALADQHAHGHFGVFAWLCASCG